VTFVTPTLTFVTPTLLSLEAAVRLREQSNYPDTTRVAGIWPIDPTGNNFDDGW
jgi:hypothetical protein